MPTSEVKIGVYVCHCGINISHTVDVETVAQYAASLPNVTVARDYTYMCSDPGQSLIKQDIAELGLTRVVVASCSPLMHEATFRNAAQESGVNPYQVEIANIREQCSWVHMAGDTTTEKAMQLVASAVAKANRLEPLYEREAEVVPAALVVGAGVAGMQSALDIADAGFQVYLVERAAQIGGRVASLSHTFPSFELAQTLLESYITRVTEHPRITVMTQSHVQDVGGYYGNFEIDVQTTEGVTRLDVGSVIVATGYDLFDPRRKPEFSYGDDPRVMTSLEYEQLLPQTRR
jgi:heterodisulfide reductase subunit A2